MPYKNPEDKKKYMAIWSKNYNAKQEVKERKKQEYLEGKDKIIKRSRDWYKNNKEKVSYDRKKKLYGIDKEIENQLLENQNFACKICLKNLSDKLYHIDHCHKSNKVRGILCVKCNTGLGKFEDNIEYLQNAIKYLEKNK